MADQIFLSPQVKQSVIISNTLVYTSYRTIPVMYYNQQPNNTLVAWYDPQPPAQQMHSTHSKCPPPTSTSQVQENFELNKQNESWAKLFLYISGFAFRYDIISI